MTQICTKFVIIAQHHAVVLLTNNTVVPNVKVLNIEMIFKLSDDFGFNKNTTKLSGK